MIYHNNKFMLVLDLSDQVINQIINWLIQECVLDGDEECTYLEVSYNLHHYTIFLARMDQWYDPGSCTILKCTPDKLPFFSHSKLLSCRNFVSGKYGSE